MSTGGDAQNGGRTLSAVARPSAEAARVAPPRFRRRARPASPARTLGSAGRHLPGALARARPARAAGAAAPPGPLRPPMTSTREVVAREAQAPPRPARALCPGLHSHAARAGRAASHRGALRTTTTCPLSFPPPLPPFPPRPSPLAQFSAQFLRAPSCAAAPRARARGWKRTRKIDRVVLKRRPNRPHAGAQTSHPGHTLAASHLRARCGWLRPDSSSARTRARGPQRYLGCVRAIGFVTGAS